MFFRKGIDDDEEEVEDGPPTSKTKTARITEKCSATSRWWLNGSEVKEKRVVEFVNQLNIQTGNLCQVRVYRIISLQIC